MTIRKNVGLLDRILRIGIGSLFIYFGLVDHTLIKDSLAGVLLGGMGGMFILIALIAYCPLYSLIDFTTVREKI